MLNGLTTKQHARFGLRTTLRSVRLPGILGLSRPSEHETRDPLSKQLIPRSTCGNGVFGTEPSSEWPASPVWSSPAISPVLPRR